MNRIGNFIMGTIFTMMLFPDLCDSVVGVLVAAIGFPVLGMLYKCFFDVVVYGEVKQ